MKKIIFILICLFLFNLKSFADFKIVDIDKAYYNINGIKNFIGNYSNISPGFFGTNFSKNININIEQENTSYLGFIGTNFSFNINKDSIKNIVPVGFFLSYSGMILDFGLGDNKNLEISEEIKNNDIPSNNHCILENSIENISYEINNDGYRDYIKLSWKTYDNIEKIKIIKVSSPQNQFEISGNINEYIDYDIGIGRNMYFIVSYNGCGAFLYSDLININYEIKDNIPNLIFKDNIISFLNYKENDAKLFCFTGEKKIIEKFLNNNYEYVIDDKYLNEIFYCYVEYTDNKKILKSNIIYNNVFGEHISIKEFFKLIYGDSITIDEIYKNFYYILRDIDLETKLNYKILSTLLIKIYANLIIDDNELSIKLLQKIGLYDSETIFSDNVNYEKLVYYLSKINSNTNFRNDILQNIDEVFNLNKQKVFFDFIKISNINLELNKLQDEKKLELIFCFNYTGCKNYKYYYEFLGKIEKQIDKKEYEKLGINFNSNLKITWREYSNIIFKIIGKQEFYNKSYSLSDYQNFINILIEAIFYGEGIIDNELTYFTYKGLNLELITNKELFHSITYLTKNHLSTINEIYNKIAQKEKLLLIIREYLNK